MKSWILKKYDNDAENGPLDLVNVPRVYAVRAVHSRCGPTTRISAAVSVPLSTFARSKESRRRQQSITFEYADDVMSVRKTFELRQHATSSSRHQRHLQRQSGASPPGLALGIRRPDDAGRSMRVRSDRLPVQQEYRAPANQEDQRRSEPCPAPSTGPARPTSISPPSSFPTIRRPPRWSRCATRSRLRRDPQKITKEKTNVEILGAAVGNLHGPTSERIFVGPKELEVLQKIPVPGVSGADNDLNGLVDFGWWGIIAKPLFVWLKWTYHHVVANWGWAIVLQTLIISLALLPLRITQMKSMLKMQRVAPQIKSIQEKYKKYSLRDPRKAAMNEEISARLQERRRESRRRLPAHADPDAVSVRVLPHAVQRHSTCGTRTGSGSTTCRPLSRCPTSCRF